MNARLRRLSEPAQTSRTDSFKWTDRRPKFKQVASGFRIAGGLITGFIVILAVIGALARLSDDPLIQTGRSVFASWSVLILAAIVMLWTANRWAPFVAGFFFGPAVLKILSVLLFEQESYYSSHSISRTDLAMLLGYSVVVVVLTSRFVGERPSPTTVFDRLALTFFMFAVVKQLITPYRFPPWPLFEGGLALLAAWCFTRPWHKRRAHNAEARIHP
jgi:hypothetical protein